MYCNQCGAPLANGIAYCTTCGKATNLSPGGAVPPPAVVAASSSAVGRVTKHRNVLGILWLVRALMVLPGAMVMVGFSHFGLPSSGPWWDGTPSQVPHFLGPLLGSIGSAMLVLALLDAITGIGLLTTQTWARMLAIVVGIIELISIPFGTALGIYTLWVLLPDISEREYNALALARTRTQI